MVRASTHAITATEGTSFATRTALGCLSGVANQSRANGPGWEDGAHCLVAVVIPSTQEKRKEKGFMN